MEPYIIEKSFTIHGGGMLRRVVVPARHLKEEDDMTFMHVSSVCTYMIALCCSGPDHGRRPLSKTNIVEQLTALRNAKMKVDIASIGAATASDDLDAFDGLAAKKPSKKARLSAAVANVGIVTILTPTIGDVQGIDMKVLGGHQKWAPLYVELDPENIAYLRSACQWQLEHEDFKRLRNKKKVVDCVDVDPDCKHEEIGGEHVNHVDVKEVGSPSQTESPPPKENLEHQCDPRLATPVKLKATTLITNFFKRA